MISIYPADEREFKDNGEKILHPLKALIYKEDNGEKTPITQKVIQPKVEGAIVTAQGANNANTKANIIQAIEAVTGLPTHKIQVFQMN